MRLAVDGAVSVVAVDGARAVRRDDDGRPADVEVSTTRVDVIALVDGDLDLLDAVLSDRVRVRGASPDLVAFDAALMAFLDGAVRAPSMLLHWERYLEADDVHR